MKVLIAGGGQTLYFLCRSFVAKGYGVILVNRSREECLRLARKLTATVVWGDASDASTLEEAGARVEIVTPDRSFAPEVMAMNLVPYMRALQGRDTVFTVTWRLVSVARGVRCGPRVAASVEPIEAHHMAPLADQVPMSQRAKDRARLHDWIPRARNYGPNTARVPEAVRRGD